MRTPSLTIRTRWALVCAGLVTASGAIVLALILVMTDHLLADAAPRALGGPPAPAVTPGPDGRPGPPSDGVPPSGRRPIEQERLDRGREVTTEVIREVRVAGFVTLGALAMLSVGIGWIVAGRMLRPIHRVTDAARAVSGSRLGERIGSGGPPDELTELSDTFDAMLDRLDRAFAAQQTFVSDASHELRTPLAVMRTGLEVTLDDPSASIPELRSALAANVGVLERMSDLVDRLLALSRADTLASVSEVDLADTAGEAASVVQAEVSVQARLSVHTELRPAPVRGDPVLLERLVVNLVDNAVLHNRHGGSVWITTGIREQSAELRVENDGAVIDPTEVDGLFERFVRTDPTVEGTGIGLAVVAAIVATHGGEIRATARSEGGLRLVVSLPVAEPTGTHTES